MVACTFVNSSCQKRNEAGKARAAIMYRSPTILPVAYTLRDLRDLRGEKSFTAEVAEIAVTE